MSKLKIWSLPVIIVVLALAGLVYFRGKLPDKMPSTEVPTTVEVVESSNKPKGFAKPPEPSDQEKAEKDTDAIVAALNAGDISGCAEITWDLALKERCEDDLNYPVILKSGDPSQCKRLHSEDLKKQCYDKVYMSSAVDEKNAALCEKIKDEDLKQMCLDQVTMIVAHDATTISGCASITSESLKKQCEDNYYFKSSTRQLDEEGCDKISDSTLAAQCKKTVTKNIEVKEQSEIAFKNSTTLKTPQEILSLCGNLQNDKAVICRDAVYPQLAYENKDISFCSKISDAEKAEECRIDQTQRINTYYLRQAIALKDKSLCSEISDNDLKQVCQSS